MERALGVAVVATAPVVRQGLALQLRLRGVAVPAEAATLRELDTQTPVHGLVLVADPRHDPQALSALLIRGTSVVALHEGVRPAPPVRTAAPGPGRPDPRGWSRPTASATSSARRTSALAERPAGTTATASATVGGAVTHLRRTSRRGRLVVLDLAGLADVDVVLEHLRQLCEGPSRRSGTAAPLTPTERSVHALLGQGYSNVGIAEILGLSPKTVEGCVSAVFSKLGLQRDDPARNRRVAAALRWFAAAN
ncbi:MAG: helix-turn-helix transcriptional regulator [Cellulomonas sp.]|nr:helix-turn-helix transcriptional regulator [Cellulomonas sp.]